MASFFGNVIDFIFDKTNAFNPDTVEANVKKNNFSSIAAKASEGILQFPLIISDTVDYDTAILVAKACERSYGAFVQVIFSMNQDLADAGAGNVSDYLKVFHQNDGQSTTDSDKGSLGDIIESFTLDDPKTETTFECELYSPKQPIMVQRLKEELRPYIEDFCMTKLNDMYQPERITNASTSISMEGFREPAKHVVYSNTLKEATDKPTDNRNEIFPAELLSGEVKKANEMQPLFLVIHLIKKSPNGGENIRYNITIGIKCTLHLVKSSEYISNLVDACEYKGTLFRFIKWTSGEIGFLRDFVLRMDLFEKETKNRVMSNSGWWEALKKRARSAKMSKIGNNRLLPNATFVFSRAEVDNVKANFGYDLLSPSVAKSLMKEYFLLGYVVVDASDETVRVMYDGQSKFQIYTFASLERENNNQERVFKQMLRDVKKM
jgi:hypothetical protein